MTTAMFPQVTAICGDIEASQVTTIPTLCSDLRKYAVQVQEKPTPSRERRHWITDSIEQRAKLIAETGFDITGDLVEPPAEQWARPQAQPLYQRLCRMQPGTSFVRDYGAEDLRHLAWMIESELVDLAMDGTIWLLSDAEPPGRSYPGSPVSDMRSRIGTTHRIEITKAFALEAIRAIFDGHPIIHLPADLCADMIDSKGIRISGRLICAHVNKMLADLKNASCNCLGRDQVANAWDLADHASGCPCRERWFSLETVRRAVKELVVDEELERTAPAYETRRGHTEYRVPCAYAIPPDAGWHQYAGFRRPSRHKAWSALRHRLLGTSRKAPSPRNSANNER
jgi:hypothetical protein